MVLKTKSNVITSNQTGFAQHMTQAIGCGVELGESYYLSSGCHDYGWTIGGLLCNRTWKHD
jgi:hypothetical protein